MKRKIFKIFASGSLILCLMVFTLIFIFMRYPALVLSESSIDKIRKNFLEKNLSWQKLQFKIESPSFSQKKLSFSIHDLRLQTETIEFLSPEVTFVFQVALSPFNFGLKSIDAATVQDAHLKYRQIEDSDSQKGILSEWFDFLSTIKVGPLDLDFSRIEILGTREKMGGSAHLQASGLNSHTSDQISLRLRQLEGLPAKNMEIEIFLDQYRHLFDDLAKIRMNTKTDSDYGLLLTDLNLKPRNEAGIGRELNFSASLKRGHEILRSSVQGHFLPGEFKGDLSMEAKLLTDYQVSFDLRPCDFNISWTPRPCQSLKETFHARVKQVLRTFSSAYQVLACVFQVGLSFNLTRSLFTIVRMKRPNLKDKDL